MPIHRSNTTTGCAATSRPSLYKNLATVRASLRQCAPNSQVGNRANGYRIHTTSPTRSPMQHTDIPASGSYRVERISGLLPPGLGKTIDGDRGVTTLGGHPVASFGTAGRSLIYDWLPVRDRLQREPDGSWTGRGIVAGIEFCRFRLVPEDTPGEDPL